MDVKRLLAKLAQKTNKYQEVTGGISELSQPELAGYLSGLKRGPYYLARYAYIGDESSYPEFERWFYQEVCSAAVNWRFDSEDKGKERIRRLCRFAISEIIDPQRCPNCKGRGEALGRSPVPVECTLCRGSGYKKTSERAHSRAVGVSVTAYRKTWAWRYKKAVDILHDWQGEALTHIYKKLQRDQH